MGIDLVPCPPSRPPRLLSEEQVAQLSARGYLQLQSLPTGLVDSLASLQNAAKQFFQQTECTKRAQYPSSQGTELGYYHVKGEKEYVTLRHIVHEPQQDVESLATDCWKKISALLYRVLADLSDSIDVDLHAWDPLLDGCMTLPASLEEATPTLMRIFRYEPATGIAEQHRDLGLLTLCVGTGSGLQVQPPPPHGCVDEDTEGDQWEDVDGPTVLIGNVLRAMSGNRLAAGLHRVVGNPNGRSSVVFALRPSIRHTIDISTFGLGQEIHRMEDIWITIKDRAFNINATKDVREKKREELMNKKLPR